MFTKGFEKISSGVSVGGEGWGRPIGRAWDTARHAGTKAGKHLHRYRKTT